MDFLVPLMSLISIIVAGTVSHALTRRMVGRLRRRSGSKPHPLASEVGIAIVFGIIFIVVWCVTSLLLVLPLVLAQVP